MISRKYFNSNLNDILELKKIENRNIDNIDIIKYITNDSIINKSLYTGFVDNYNSEYGNDMSYFIMKLQDMLYRVHLLVNYNFIDNFGVSDKEIIKDTFLELINNKTIDLYDAVSYDDSDYEIIELQQPDVRDALLIKKI